MKNKGEGKDSITSTKGNGTSQSLKTAVLGWGWGTCYRTHTGMCKAYRCKASAVRMLIKGTILMKDRGNRLKTNGHSRRKAVSVKRCQIYT